jgi:hypothetical protein
MDGRGRALPRLVLCLRLAQGPSAARNHDLGDAAAGLPQARIAFDAARSFVLYFTVVCV